MTINRNLTNMTNKYKEKYINEQNFQKYSRYNTTIHMLNDDWNTF